MIRKRAQSAPVCVPVCVVVVAWAGRGVFYELVKVMLRTLYHVR